MPQTENRTNRTAVSEIDELSAEYLDQGWQVSSDRHTGHITLIIDEGTDVVSMPADLAERVHRILRIHMLAGPVISYSADDRWAFITAPEPNPDPLPDDLVTEQVTGVRPGTRLRLPANHRGFGGVRWIARPEPGRSAPPRQAVLSAARRALSEALLEHTA
jgi:hypothetical protein